MNRFMLRSADISPSADHLKVVSAFNPGAAAVDDAVALLVRVAESRNGVTGLPRWDRGAVIKRLGSN